MTLNYGKKQKMYSPKIIWNGARVGPPVYRPQGPVELRVYRADLMGIAGVGALAGLFHTGLSFVEPGTGTEWVVDLSAEGSLMNAVLPTVDARGSVVINPKTVLEYYPNEEKPLWESYWKSAYRSGVVCTIDPVQYGALMDYILGPFTATLGTYSLFSLETPSQLEISQSPEIRSSRSQYTRDMTCDSLPLDAFMFLHNRGVPCAPFPMLRVTVSCKAPPVPVTNMADPELVAFVSEVDQLVKQIPTQQHPLASMPAVLVYQALANPMVPPVPANLFFYSLDFKTGAPAFYRSPTGGTSLNVADFTVSLDNGTPDMLTGSSTSAEWWVAGLVALVLVALGVYYWRRRRLA